MLKTIGEKRWRVGRGKAFGRGPVAGSSADEGRIVHDAAGAWGIFFFFALHTGSDGRQGARMYGREAERGRERERNREEALAIPSRCGGSFTGDGLFWALGCKCGTPSGDVAAMPCHSRKVNGQRWKIYLAAGAGEE